jgi:Flp pilus assembly protein protease CpaA
VKAEKNLDFLLLRAGILLAGCAAAAYTDARTGLILDKITYPMIAAGIALNLVELNWLFLGVGGITFALGWAMYYAGKVGGGDVKLLTAMAFLLPLYGQQLFIINALFLGAALAVIFYSAYYLARYFKNGIDLKENRQGIKKTAALAAAILGYFALLLWLQMITLPAAMVLGLPVGLALLFMAFEKGIRHRFFLRSVALGRLEEDEVIAAEFLESRIKKRLKLGFRGVFGKKEIALLKKMGVKNVPVYRGMPPFAPFILLGCIGALAQPNIIGILFLH